MDKFPLWADHIIAFLYGIAIPLYAAYKRPKELSGKHFESHQKKQIYINNSLSLLVMAIVVFLAWVIFRRPLAALGFKQVSNISDWWWLIAIFMTLYITDTVTAIVSKENFEKNFSAIDSKTPFMPTKRQELPLYFLMCFSAAVFEEIIFRGFLVTYCIYLFSGFKDPYLWAVIIPAIVFSIAHYYQGIKAVFKIFILSLLFGYIFIRSESLWLVIILHFVVDAAAGVLTFKYMREEKEIPG
ncbi:MAG TPA: CPBP family intramembrane glutamic endopeptidase [Chitinophagaceae bacterium]|nr:CPBP family intramembrane glutamic endopeptidase [Chitinophagaceae bacterium]